MTAQDSENPWPETVDLASRALGGSVVWANDEFFGMKENLVTPAAPTFSPHTFNLKGQIVDGWETRRRRAGGPGVEGSDHDTAIIRLGAPGTISGVTVDTSFFVGNYPPACSLEAICAPGFPSPAELLAAAWTTIVPESKLRGDTHNRFTIDPKVVGKRFTHVRLNNIPDGGIARLRVHGAVLADPEFTVGVQCDLAAARNGARIAGSSNAFFSPALAALMPGESRVMGEGWETARRRDDGNDWLTVGLAAPGVLHDAVIDTTCFVGNAPGWARLTDADTGAELLPRTRLQPDTEHHFRLVARNAAGRVRLDIYPDGGISRLRLHGTIPPAEQPAITDRWQALLPPRELALVDQSEYFS
ncbi:MAG TPA: allantoicase [Thermoleophilia bacterium]|nr:allantoicase [Thermoleophilia bacterium]